MNYRNFLLNYNLQNGILALFAKGVHAIIAFAVHGTPFVKVA